jgi:hypothetical protein
MAGAFASFAGEKKKREQSVSLEYRFLGSNK